MNKRSDNFSFFVDNITLEKAGKDAEGNDIMKVGGIATTKAKDTDGEEIDENGWDVDYFVKSGFFNYNHQSKFNPAAVIGEPTSARVTKDGVYVEGYLYAGSELAKSVYDTTKLLEKSSGTRRMGFSIEGKALERDPFNEKRITKARLTGCALTLNPKNPNTLVNIIKGEYHTDDFIYDFSEDEEGIETKLEKSEDYIVYLEKDNKIVCIDKNLNIKITEKEGSPEINKSLSTESGSAVMVESVDQDAKDKERLPKIKKYLTKGEVYSEIFNYIYDCDLDTADLMIKHIEETAPKNIQMNKGTTGITKDDIQKSLDIVIGHSAISNNDLEKGEQPGEEEEEDMDTKMEKAMAEDEEFQRLKKACESSQMAMDQYKEKIEKGEVSGYPTTASAKSETMIGDENAASIGKEGEFIKKSEGEGKDEDMKKSIDNDLMKSIESAIEKGLSGTMDIVQELARATRGVLEMNNDLEKSLDSEVRRSDDLKKSLDGVLDRLEEVENTPIPSKTVTSQNYHKHPTLEKSMDGGTVIDARQQKNVLLEILDRKSGLEEGQTPNMMYAQGMAEFESSGVLSKSIVSDLKKSENIDIVGL